MISLKRTTSDDPDFQALVTLLDQVLKIVDGDQHSFYDQFNKIDQIRNVVVCYSEGRPVGCGAFKAFDADIVEIKRMYVQPDVRGKGVASSVLTELEQWAKELNYTACILETGKKQVDAVGLYLKAGYAYIPNYGQYETVETSVCMKKEIG
jgi:GNAT superfamily N-acetyltransferase